MKQFNIQSLINSLNDKQVVNDNKLIEINKATEAEQMLNEIMNSIGNDKGMFKLTKERLEKFSLEEIKEVYKFIDNVRCTSYFDKINSTDFETAKTRRKLRIATIFINQKRATGIPDTSLLF